MEEKKGIEESLLKVSIRTYIFFSLHYHHQIMHLLSLPVPSPPIHLAYLAVTGYDCIHEMQSQQNPDDKPRKGHLGRHHFLVEVDPWSEAIPMVCAAGVLEPGTLSCRKRWNDG